MMTFEAQHEEYVARCNAAIQKAEAGFLQADSVVSEAARYTLDNGGKRVRGVLTLAVCDLLGGNAEAAEVFAAAIEMMHAFSLIHDDLPCMDNDDMRRGKPACHIKYGEANALLAGDALSIAALQAAATAPCPPAGQAAAAALLAGAAGARGMIYGQELDLKYETQMATDADLRRVQTFKTGALILAAAQLGQIAAEIAPQPEDDVAVYANNIGLAFQIIDDILDVTADETMLGKPVGSDVASGKTTFVTLHGLDMARKQADKLTKNAADVAAKYDSKGSFLVQFASSLAARVI